MHNTTYIPLYFTFEDAVIREIHVFMILIQYIRLSLDLLLINIYLYGMCMCIIKLMVYFL